MQILRFPTLVQKEIFENLDFDELLILSFLSKRCKQSIQTLQKNRFKKIETIVYYFGWRDSISITVESVDSEYLLRLYLNPCDKSPLNPMKIFGITKDVSLDDWNSWCINFYYNLKRKHSIIEGVHTHLYELFGLSVEYEIESDPEKLPPSLKYINRSALHLPKNTTGEELELCFAASPNQEYVSITDYDDFELASNSILYGVQHLHMDMHGRFARPILFNFRGKSLLLSSLTLFDISLVRFLNVWKSNKGFANLRFFSILFNGNLDDVWIKNRVDIKQSEVALELKWKKRTMEGTKFGFEWMDATSTSNDYLIRDIDGARAFVEFSKNTFRFYVSEN